MEKHPQIRLWKNDTSCGTPEKDFQPYIECYLHPAGGRRAAVLVCPGGGYGGRAAHEGAPVAERFNQLGFHAFVLHYRVAPYRFPEPQRDALRAIKLIRSRAAEFGVIPDQLAIGGFSAGGHLAGCAGTMYREIEANDGDAADGMSSRPDAVILCYAVAAFCKEWGHRGSGENLLGEKLEELEARFILPDQVNADTPPTFLWHTAEDQAVPVENCLFFAQALRRNNVLFGLHVYPVGRHGIGLAPDFPDARNWPELCADFLKHRCHFQCEG